MEVYAIAGGPGVGKSTVIKELFMRDYHVLCEAAREVNKRKNLSLKKRQDLIFDIQLKKLQWMCSDNITFSDRGLGDTLAYYPINNLKIPEAALKKAREYRYKKVFILDPLPNYKRDRGRKETKEEAMILHNAIKWMYLFLGYQPIYVPAVKVSMRVDYILKRVKRNGTN